jgi:hypothetical protein
LSKLHRIDATYDGTNWAPLRSDSASDVLETISYQHHEIHGGSSYRVSINKDVAGSGTYNIAWTTADAAKWPHMVWTVETEGEVEIMFYEGITSWTGGSAITPLNADRNSGNASNITDMVYDGTLTLGTPTTLEAHVIGSASGPVTSHSGGDASARNEWILDQGVKYAIVVTDQSGSSNEVNIILDWYEHTNRR